MYLFTCCMNTSFHPLQNIELVIALTKSRCHCLYINFKIQHAINYVQLLVFILNIGSTLSVAASMVE